MKSAVPKQFLLLDGVPIIIQTIKAFLNFNSETKFIIVLPKAQNSLWENIVEKFPIKANIETTFGGETRFHSVKNGLSKVNKSSIVAVHDAVRPLVSNKTIKRAYESARNNGNGVPAIEVTDSYRIVDSIGQNKSVDRQKLRSIQTPQIFKSEILLSAYNIDFSNQFTDDASVIESSGETINLTVGNSENIKITRPQDLILAEELIKKGHQG
jgi:2-C-methyl-D-erythritol 4-phosphate cytidylyltransferase